MLIVLATCVAPRLRHPFPAVNPVDFNVYYAASLLIAQGHAAQLYAGADTGSDPQKAIALPGSPIYNDAHSQGLSFVGLYVYPPILADLLLPLTKLSLRTATEVWLAANVAFILATALLVVRLLRLRLLGAHAALVFLAIACFTPVLQCVADGQITVFLLLLWAAAMMLYGEDRFYASGAVFALAAAIKLTPALVLVAFLIWRNWRVAGAFLVSLGGLGAICLWFNTPHAVSTYFTRVMPAMSGAMPSLLNFSIAAATERLAALFQAATPQAGALTPLQSAAGRAVSVCLLAALVVTIFRTRKSERKSDQLLVLGLLGLMAPILSPVSWFHAYSTAFIAFALLWRDCLARPVSNLYLTALTAVSLLLGSAVSENVLPLLAGRWRQDGLASGLQFAQLLAAAGIVLYRIGRIGGGITEQNTPDVRLAEVL